MFTVIFLFSVSALSAAEYVVARKGNDANDGKSKENAFATIAKGVSFLNPGDTLTICPGEYFESVMSNISGTENAPITIRAERRGTAIIRGDLPLHKEFARVPGFKFTYVCDQTNEVRGIIERDSLTLYSPVASLDAVDRRPGRYFHDAAAGNLYLHTGNSSHPNTHDLTLSGVVGTYGLYITPRHDKDAIRNIIIEGLAFTGFAQSIPNSIKRSGIGVGVFRPQDCVIRHCTAFLNAIGITFVGRKHIVRHKETALKQGGVNGCLIENCIAYGNDPGHGSGASIICRSTVRNSVIRNCIAFHSYQCIRFYSGVIENCTLENNIVFMPGDLHEKGNFSINNAIIGNVCSTINNYGNDNLVTRNIARGVTGPAATAGTLAADDNIFLNHVKGDLNLPDHFADPVHLDYRLQSDSTFRGTGRAPYVYKDEVFFVKPDGNDSADGTSINKAWKSADKACNKVGVGQTLYLLPGNYDAVLCPPCSGEEGKPLVFRRRGYGEVILKGIDIKGKSHINIEGLTVMTGEGYGLSISDGRDISVRQCVVASCKTGGAKADNVKDLRISHCTLTKNTCGLELKGCDNAVVTDNIFANSEVEVKLNRQTLISLFSDCNSYSMGNRSFIVDSFSFLLPDRLYDLVEWQELTGLDIHSHKLVPEFSDPAKGKYYLNNAPAFNGRGLLAMPIGPYERIRKFLSPKRTKLQVHSKTGTTANIDCESPGVLSLAELRWGETPECKRRVWMPLEWAGPYMKSLSHSFSLTGLKPGATYFFRAVLSVFPRVYFANEEMSSGDEKSETRNISSKVMSFATPDTDEPSRIYHVALSGSDSNTGLSRANALRTMNCAARKAKAGDTVNVHDGTYKEYVTVSATGDKDRPITFKAQTPGNVFLTGDGLITRAFEIPYRSHIVIDGFYISNFAGRTADSAGYVSIFGGSDITIRRCIFDGRMAIPSQTVVAKCTRKMTLENCVFRNNSGAFLFYSCPEMTIRNNVFYGNMVGGLSARNSPDDKFTFSHNIICDQVPKKRMNPLISCSYLDSMIDEYNCFFTRFPENKKFLYGIKRSGVREKLTFPEFRKRTGKGQTSFFGNPGMKIMKEYKIFQGDMTGRVHNFVTQEMNCRTVRGQRLPIISLYDDFLATNPRCVKADDGIPIGLDPDAFENAVE